MKLRTAISADWAEVPPQRLNFWQRMAKRSYGFLTPGNVISVLGVILVYTGAVSIYRENVSVNITLIAAGRLLDLVDGFVADRTGTKSPLGEAIDVTADKVAAGIVLTIFFVQNLVPLTVLLVIAAQAIINATIALIAKLRRYPFHPSTLGKLSVGVAWVSLVTYALATLLRRHENFTASKLVYFLANLCVVLFIILGVKATYDYGSSLASRKPKQKNL